MLLTEKRRESFLFGDGAHHKKPHSPTHPLGAVRQQAITWDNDDPDLCLHMVSLGHNELNFN